MAEVGHQLVWMGWQSIQIVGVSAYVIFILLQKMQKMAKCTFWYQLTRVVPDKIHEGCKTGVCVCACIYACVRACVRACMCVHADDFAIMAFERGNGFNRERGVCTCIQLCLCDTRGTTTEWRERVYHKFTLACQVWP